MSNTPDPRRLTWVKSTYSDGQGGQCIEWAPEYAAATGVVPIQDSKTSNGPVLMVSADAWSNLVGMVRADG